MCEARWSARATVLLIDDEPEMSELVGQWLDLIGAGVVRVGTFEDAVASAKWLRPRVVLLDISLGDEDGLELLPRLRASHELGQVPIVVFSVHASKRRVALDEGAAGFVPKPFEGGDLIETLRPFLA